MPAHTFKGIAHSGARSEFILLTAVAEKEGRTWVARCLETGTAAQARSVDDAIARLSEAIELHLATLEDVGELERFLSDQNIAVRKSRPRQTRLNVNDLTPGSLATTLVQQLPEHSDNTGRELVTA